MGGRGVRGGGSGVATSGVHILGCLAAGKNALLFSIAARSDSSDVVWGSMPRTRQRACCNSKRVSDLRR